MQPPPISCLRARPALHAPQSLHLLPECTASRLAPPSPARPSSDACSPLPTPAHDRVATRSVEPPPVPPPCARAALHAPRARHDGARTGAIRANRLDVPCMCLAFPCARQSACGCSAMCSKRAPRRSQTSSGPFLYIMKGFGSAIALPSTPTLAEYWPQCGAALRLLGGSCALFCAANNASFACHALSHAVKASRRQRDAAGMACDAARRAPSALEECAIESDTLFQLSRRSRGQRIAKSATFRPL